MAQIRDDSREAIIEKVRELIQMLQAEGLDITVAYLYGSRAMGMPREDSDIDIAIVSPELSGDRLKDWCRLNRAASQLDARMEVIGFRPEQFRDEHPLVWEVKTHGIKLS